MNVASVEECPMLMGKYQNSIDIKFRMIVPSKFRDKLEYKCVLTRGIDHCLYIYPMDEWEILMKKLSSLPMSDPDARAFVRHFYANAVECDIDKQVRITLPQELREWAGIKKDLVTLGILNRIEIWSIDSWEDTDNKTELDHSDFAKKMIEYGI
jgi:MraZ protein